MSAMEMIGLQVTAPGAGGAAMAAVAGNSLQIRNTRSKISLLAIGTNQQSVAGTTRITSPLLHDTTVGITTVATTSTSVINILPHKQELQAQDSLSVFRTGSGTAGDIEQTSLFAYYDDLPGTDAKLIDRQELNQRGEEMYCWSNTVTATGAGGYTGSQAINTNQDQLKANRDYAILGMTLTTSAILCAARLVGPDWGNLGIGIPNISQDADMMSRWFQVLSGRVARPCIPVFNASNKVLTFISALANENGASIIIGLVAVLLAPAGAGSQRRSDRGRSNATGRYVAGGCC